MSEEIFFPKNVENFQRFFLKIEIIESSVDKEKSVSTIYLPLPKGLLREDFQLDYSQRELGVIGELVKDKYEGVRNALSNVLSGKKNLASEGPSGSSGPSTLDTLGSLATTAYNAFDTYLSKEIMMTDNKFFKLGTQGLGLTRAPNFTLLFDGVSRVREFTLDWKITPKNEEDAIELEKIIKAIQKSSLPSLSDTSFSVLNTAGRESLRAFNATTNYLGFANTIFGDVTEKYTDKTFFEDNQGQWFSSVFKIPNELKLTICERIKGNSEIEEGKDKIGYFMNFPYTFVVRDLNTFYGSSGDVESFIKGEKGYYHQTYEINLIIMETKIYTADDAENLQAYNG